MSVIVKTAVASALAIGALAVGVADLGPPAPGEDPIVREHGLPTPPARERPALSPEVQRSVELERRGDLEGAARTAEAAVQESDSRDARLQAAKVAILLGRLDQAEAMLAPLVAADPSDVEAQYDLALVAHRRGDLESARAAYGRALKAYPGHADARYNLALVVRELGEAEAARAEAEALARFHPADPRPGPFLATLGDP